ncbi:hypothetical protein NENIHHPF_00092 [Enterococcus phage EF_FB]
MLNIIITVISTVVILKALEMAYKKLSKRLDKSIKFSRKKAKKRFIVARVTEEQAYTLRLLKAISKDKEAVCEATNKALLEYGYEEAGGHSMRKLGKSFPHCPT